MNTRREISVLKHTPLISIIVPVYNTENYLERCINSILAQTYENLEIIIVDDASTDKSAELMCVLKNRDERIRCIRHKKNMGLFQARITGSEVAKGEYIAFVDSDDYISIDWFRTLLKKADSTDSDIVVGEWCFDNNGANLKFANLDPFRINDYCLEGKDIIQSFMAQEGTCFSWTVVWNKLYSKKLWDACMPSFRSFSEQHGHMLMWEDIAFSSALWVNAKKVTNVHSVLYFYFKHDSAATKITKDSNKNLKYIADSSAALKFMRKCLSSVENDEKIKIHFDNWKCRAASMLYHDLVTDKHSLAYIQKIRDAFDFQGDFKDVEHFFYSLTTDLHPSFWWQENIKKEIVSPDTQYVSFDVFDTLVQRPFLEPTDLFCILSDELNQNTSSYVDFAELRISAERSCRDKKALLYPSAEDITLDEIYDYLAETTILSQDLLTHMKQREQELELYFCKVREAGKMFFDLALDAEKKIIICSDMYLPMRTIEQILEKAGYSGYYKLYVSSELMLTKATGNLFKYVQKDLKCKKATAFLHIGDNWDSDVVKPQSLGWKTGHMSKAVDLLRNYNPGNYSGEGFNRIWGNNGQQTDYLECLNSFPGLRNIMGLAATRLFKTPFVSINQSSDFNADPNFIGYFCFGPHLLAVSEWILKIAKERNIPTIHFVARDGYILKQTFDMINDSKTTSSYIRLSRKALILADVNNVEDIYSLYNKLNVLSLSPQKLIGYLAPIISLKIEQVKEILKKNKFFYDRNFKSVSEYKRCIKVLSTYVLDFSLLPAYHNDLRQYFEKIIKPGDYIFDIGYSGRAEAALSNILGFPVGCLYIHVNSDLAEKRQRKYNCPCECFYDYKPGITGVIREHLMMELGPSTIGYEKANGTLTPKFEPYEENYTSDFITRAIQNSAISFVQDYCSIFGVFKDSIVLPLKALSAPFEYYLHYSKAFDRQLFSTLPFEDSLYQCNNFVALNFWNQEIYHHGLQLHQGMMNGSPAPISPYSDGLFMKFYNFINKRFPKGGKKREFAKKIAKIFLR